MSADVGDPGLLADSPQRLYNVYEQDNLWEVLELDTPWTATDLPCGINDAKATMNRLRAIGAVEVVGSVSSGESPSKRCHLYAFSDGVRELLEDYRERISRFECGHRAHIHNKESGGYGCQYCDQERDYDRETVLEAIA